MQGYLDAANAFAEESGTSMDRLDSSEERMHIRTALEKGNIEDAISRVNDLNPEVRSYPVAQHLFVLFDLPDSFALRECFLSHGLCPINTTLETLVSLCLTERVPDPGLQLGHRKPFHFLDPCKALEHQLHAQHYPMQ